MTLYEMTDAARNLKALLDADEIDDQAFADTLEAIGTEQKIDSYCQIIREYEAEIEARKAIIERMKVLNAGAESSIALMKKALDAFMRASGQSKAKTTMFTVSYRRSESIDVYDETAIPEQYMTIKVTKSPDKTAIKAYIKGGGTVSGAKLTEKMNLQIK